MEMAFIKRHIANALFQVQMMSLSLYGGHSEVPDVPKPNVIIYYARDMYSRYVGRVRFQG